MVRKMQLVPQNKNINSLQSLHVLISMWRRNNVYDNINIAGNNTFV